MLTLRHRFPSAATSLYFDDFIAASAGACRWFGLGIEFLSPPPEVTANALRSLVENRHPITNEPLVGPQAPKKPRSSPWFTEVVFTPPPSLPRFPGKNHHIAALHCRATEAAMDDLELLALSHTRREGIPFEIYTSNIVAVSFHFCVPSSGRNLPQSRYLLFPPTFDEEENEWLRLDTAEMVQELSRTTRRYLSELRVRLWQQGFDSSENPFAT